MKFIIQINGQSLNVFTPPKLVADTVNYFSADFVFKDSAWDGLSKYAHFKCGENCYDVALENDSIPAEAGLNLAAGDWELFLHGERYEDGELAQRITTESWRFKVAESGCLEGSAFPSVPADLAAQLLAKVENLQVAGVNPADYDLPILALSGDDSAMSKENAVTLAYTFGEHSGDCQVKWQGSSSLAYPKKNYSIQFDQPFEAAEGWGQQSEYCAKANYIDATHARNLVSAKLWGQVVKSRKFPVGDGNLFALEKISGLNGGNNNDLYSISGEELEVSGSVYNNGFITFDGMTFPAGAYNISFEFCNSVDCDDSDEVWAGLYSDDGIDDNELLLTASPIGWYGTVAAGEWKTFFWNNVSAAAESKLMLLPKNSGKCYKFRNIKIAPADFVTSESLSRLAELPNGGAVDGFPVAVTMNGMFHGVYTLNIPKEPWLFAMDGASAQAIVGAEEHSEATQFRKEAALEGDFELEFANEESWVAESLNRLISACANSDGSDLDSEIAQYLDWESAIDYMIFTALIGGEDMTDKNYLLGTYDGVKWFFSAYDMDSTYGLAWDGSSFARASKAEPKLASYFHRVMELIWAYKKDALKARFEELCGNILSVDNVAAEFRNFCGLIPKALLEGDQRKWTGVPSTAANSVEQIVQWYGMRMEVVRGEMG